MILQSLSKLYDRLSTNDQYGLSKPGYSIQRVSYRMVIKKDGSLFQIEDARITDEKNKQHADQLLVPGEAKPSGSGINPGLLWDNQIYMLGQQPEDKKKGFGNERFEAFRKNHLDLESDVNSEKFSAICRFLEKWTPDQRHEHSILDEVGTGFGVFQIIGEKDDIHNDPQIISWWENQLETKSDDQTVGQCLITGEHAPIARLHPKIKGVPGAQAAGASIVSFNDTAYESYSKTQSFNSPVSVDAAFRYGAALNALLTGPMHSKHRIRIGDTTCVFWTETPTAIENSFIHYISSGSNAQNEVQDDEQRENIDILLKAVRSGSRLGLNDDGWTNTPFYILGLAPNAARLSIRFFHQTTTDELISHLHNHHECFKMVREFTETKGKRRPDPEFPAIWQILDEVAPRKNGKPDREKIEPILGGAIVRAIIEGTPYPKGLYNAIIRRIHLDRKINYLRAAILKAFFNRNFKNQNQYDMKQALDKNHPSEAYHLGRLFAVFEQSQRQAHDFNLDRTIRESHFGSASATPAAVFTRLHRLHIHHLRKLNPGSQKYFEDWAMEIIQNFQTNDKGEASFPSSLDLKGQGAFSIGYYHQMHEMRKKSEPEEN